MGLVEEHAQHGSQGSHVRRLRGWAPALKPIILRFVNDALRIDEVDRKILACLVEDGRSTYDDIGRTAALSAPAVKRRIDRLRERGVLRGFTALVDPAALGATTEALIELFYAPGIGLEAVRESLRPIPEVAEAWSVTGDADCIVRVRARDPQDLERIIMELQRESAVIRTRSQIIMSRLIERRD
jgi:Lrp/AsnC family transcriptional regulator, leucine-responsive regulatory protein